MGTGCRSREVELADALEEYKMGVLGLAETWLKKGEELAIPGFKWWGADGEKASGKGGGIGGGILWAKRSKSATGSLGCS